MNNDDACKVNSSRASCKVSARGEFEWVGALAAARQSHLTLTGFARLRKQLEFLSLKRLSRCTLNNTNQSVSLRYFCCMILEHHRKKSTT